MTPQQQALTIAKNWENGEQAELLAKDILDFAAQMVEENMQIDVPEDWVYTRQVLLDAKKALINQLKG